MLDMLVHDVDGGVLVGHNTCGIICTWSVINMGLIILGDMGLTIIIPEPRFPYSENLCIQCFHRTPDSDLGVDILYTLMGISSQFGWTKKNPIPHLCECVCVGWQRKTLKKKHTCSAGFGIWILVDFLRDISPYVVFIPAAHTEKSWHRTKSSHSTDVKRVRIC